MCSNSAHTDCAKQASKSGQLRKKFALQFILLVAVVFVGTIVCIKKKCGSGGDRQSC